MNFALRSRLGTHEPLSAVDYYRAEENLFVVLRPFNGGQADHRGALVSKVLVDKAYRAAMSAPIGLGILRQEPLPSAHNA